MRWFPLIAMIILGIQLASATNLSDDKIINEYIENDASQAWNIYFIEEKFGNRFVLCYLGTLILIALSFGTFIKK